MKQKKLVRISTSKNFLGVLEGFATYFSIDVTLLRIVFVLLCLATGFFPFVIGYVVAAFLMPAADA